MPERSNITDDADSALTIRGLSKRFVANKKTVEALRGIELQVRPGTVTGLIGPDGAGKTTLMRLIAGLLLPDEGSISIFGRDVLADPLSAQRIIGYMPQHFGLYEDLTVAENMNLYADLQGLPVSERTARYEELTHLTGLAPFAKRLAGKLSGGMKQKLGLACVLVRPPRLLLLDEPTVGVDPVSRRELWSIVYRLVQQDHMTALLSTAYLDEAERCGEVILLHKGAKLGQGAPDEFSRPVSGRCFQVTLPDMNKRTLQGRLARLPGVIDATIQRTGVRLVMRDTSPPDLSGLPDGVRLEPVAPRFEDGFISMLRERDGHAAPATLSLDRPDAPKAVDQAMITVDHLSRNFGSFQAVKNISFSVKQGEVFGLLGANGAGKSTTFRMLCGLLPASGGTLSVAGLDLRHASAKARARIGYMAQKFSLYGDLSVLENLRFFARAYGLRNPERSRRIEWALQEFELADHADGASKELPLGYKQRLAMAAALMHHPDILFLDEPTSGVDPLARREFWHRISSMTAEEGVTVLVTTHFMEEAEYCDRLVIMAEGDILAEGTPDEMRARVQSPECPDPTMEDAFIHLIEANEKKGGT